LRFPLQSRRRGRKRERERRERKERETERGKERERRKKEARRKVEEEEEEEKEEKQEPQQTTCCKGYHKKFQKTKSYNLYILYLLDYIVCYVNYVIIKRVLVTSLACIRKK
jgi:hypothetical protein